MVIDSGIYEFHEENGKSIGISYEKNEDTDAPVYVFNIFADEEYINISGTFSSIYDAVKVVTEEWNKLDLLYDFDKPEQEEENEIEM